jgi:ankyrin repeat protein
MISKYQEFLNEELKHLPPPTEEEFNDAINNMSAEELLNAYIKYKLGDKILKKIVEKESGSNMLLIYGLENTGNLKIVKFAVKHGADVNYVNPKNYESVLMTAIDYGTIDSFKYLLEKGANVNFIDRRGMTPLLRAAKNKNLAKVKILVEHGVDINDTGNCGKNAYYFARLVKKDTKSGNYYFRYRYSYGWNKVAEYLEQHGIDTKLPDLPH